MHCTRLHVLTRAGLLAALLILAGGVSAAIDSQIVDTQQARVRVETVVRGLEHPWGVAFLPDGRMLVTEKPGRLHPQVPGWVPGRCPGWRARGRYRGPGRLARRRRRPRFCPQSTHLPVVQRAAGRRPERHERRTCEARADRPGTGQGHLPAATRVRGRTSLRFPARVRPGRYVVRDARRPQPRPRQGPATRQPHRQGRAYRPRGQRPRRQPLPQAARRDAGAWSLGHRNVQGAALHPATGELWTNEHGPKGGDELNRTLAGRNYGWPIVTYGTEYSGKPISDRTEAPGLESPVHHWVPSIGPAAWRSIPARRFRSGRAMRSSADSSPPSCAPGTSRRQGRHRGAPV